MFWNIFHTITENTELYLGNSVGNFFLWSLGKALVLISPVSEAADGVNVEIVLPLTDGLLSLLQLSDVDALISNATVLLQALLGHRGLLFSGWRKIAHVEKLVFVWHTESNDHQIIHIKCKVHIQFQIMMIYSLTLLDLAYKFILFTVQYIS